MTLLEHLWSAPPTATTPGAVPRAARATRSRRVLLLGVALAIGIGVVNYLTGSSVSLSVFYLLPILVVTLESGRGAGWLLSGVSVAAWAVADAVGGAPNSRTGVVFWNIGVRFTVYCVNVYLLAALAGALTRARESEARSREFLAYAAHQLRTPLTGIQASAELLARDVDVESRERLLTNLLREAGRAGRLISELLRLARLDQGDAPTRQSWDVVSLCESELERIRDLAPELRVRLAVAAGPRVALVDGATVREALAVLLDNARRHARSEVDVTVQWEQSSLVMTVHDDGPGVPPEAGAWVFERFVSLDGHGGSGLGLAIARAIARAHGGDAWYDGRSFRLRLAQAVSPADQSSPLPPAPPSSAESSVSRPFPT